MDCPARPAAVLLVGIGLTGLAAPSAAQSCGVGQLALTARASLQLPSTFGIQGINAAADGALTLWSPGGEIISVDASRRLSQQQLPDTIVPLGIALLPGGGYRTLDWGTGREFIVQSDGRVSTTGQVLHRPGEELDRAIWQGDGWLLGLRDLAARQFVVRRQYPTGEVELFRSAVADSVKVIPRYNVTEMPTGLLLSQGSAPFTLIRLQRSGRLDTLPQPLAADGSGIPAESLTTWRAVSAVQLDCTLLLTLTDLTSDRRLLVRYGADDRVERITALDAPLGFMIRVPGTQTVLAARRAGELELVWYDWRWVREPSSSGH